MTETRKIVTAAVTATFQGDYYSADECPGALETWIDGTLDDRDDLRGWKITHISVVETPPEDDE